MKSYHNTKTDKWDNFRSKLIYLKEIIDPNYLLDKLGFSSSHDTVHEFRCNCPVHGGDNSTAFRFNKETKTWVCFTRKCHDVYGNDIIGLIKAVTGKDFVESVEYLKELTGDVSEIDYIESKRNREINEFIRSNSNIIFRNKEVNEEYLNKFKPLRSEYFLSKGFKEETLNYFEVAGGWHDKFGIIRDVIPIRDNSGELVAYSLRDTRPDSDNSDFKYILTPGFDKQKCLYNLDKAKRYCSKLPLIVVEGFKSVWRLHEYGINNVVASMGSGVTTGQQLLLYSYAINGVVTFFDNDIAGVNATLKAYDEMHDRIDFYPVYIQEIDEFGNGLDPADLNAEQVYEYLDTYFIMEDFR